MSQPVSELVTFTSSEAYQKDQSVLKGLIEILDATDGKLSTYHGPQVEDPSQGYLFVQWQTYEHHVALMNAPVYPKLIETLKPAVGGPFEMVHVKFNKDVTKALEKPITEVATFTLKPGKKMEQLVPLLDQLTSTSELSIWGPTLEKEDRVVLVFGWNSLEEHHEVVSKGPEELKKVLVSLNELADLKLYHSKLQKY
ncbi:hypothetical protein OE88DRAFT_1736993 [Heliocybe sulcata]|uniref:ABM domain-containing protein n=1 Tax=Heliocybe sulcata TaxID=5364 RepID=A0A5C3N6I0_9AGAM|nr:hypothetical protein OE88DRAFT_1736993 [Heliocybe sulcata]